MPATILIVCSANICRSPALAALLSARLIDVDVQSRGVHAVAGQPMCATSARWLQGQEAARPDHVSRPLTVADIRSSTIVLTATRWLRASVVEMRPSASVRTHTLAEAARTIEWRISEGARAPRPVDLNERVLWLAEQVHCHRTMAPRPSAIDLDDLPDPHHGAKHSTVLADMLAAADRLCRALTS